LRISIRRSSRGTVAVETSRKTIQHLEGGIISEILTWDGNLVHEGDVLLRLDPTRSGATDRTYRQELAIALAMEARLFAQRNMLDKVQFPEEVRSQKDDSLVAVAMRDNESQFQNRRDSLLRLIDVLEKQIAQAEREVEQAIVDEKTAQDQLDSINMELPNLRALLAKGPRHLCLSGRTDHASRHDPICGFSSQSMRLQSPLL
jgi:multidrug efflux pump subunit AcrA (membrane-fusion protein)